MKSYEIKTDDDKTIATVVGYKNACSVVNRIVTGYYYDTDYLNLLGHYIYIVGDRISNGYYVSPCLFSFNTDIESYILSRHHSALTKGYTPSFAPTLQRYKGKFGSGYTVDIHYNSKYSMRTYYIYND